MKTEAWIAGDKYVTVASYRHNQSLRNTVLGAALEFGDFRKIAKDFLSQFGAVRSSGDWNEYHDLECVETELDDYISDIFGLGIAEIVVLAENSAGCRRLIKYENGAEKTEAMVYGTAYTGKAQRRQRAKLRKIGITLA